ncbi:MAG: elongation factor P [Chloroflexota bacterium]|nr:elongation factor P [Chloroflexota bacterium]
MDTNQLRKGTTFYLNDELYQVREYQHHKPGRGHAIIRTKLRNLHTGAIIPKTFTSSDRVEEAFVERRTMQYLYSGQGSFNFMDMVTYDQISIDEALVAEKVGYLKENMEYTVVMHGNEPLDVELPPAVELKIVQSEMAVAGDTAGGASKTVVCETGLEVQVPLFVNEGDTIRVETSSGSYVTRV